MHSIHNKWRTPKTKVNKKTSEARKAASAKRWETQRSRQVGKEPQQLPNIQPENEPQPSTSRSTQPSTSENSQPSTSGRKLDYFDGAKLVEATAEEYFITSKTAIQKLLKAKNMCKCRGEILLKDVETHGFVKKLITVCSKCDGPISEAYTSQRLQDSSSTRPPFEANRVMVDAFLSIGAGYSAMERFGVESGINILSHSAWKRHLKVIEDQNEQFKASILKEAREIVRKEHGAEDDDIIDITVSYDGTWHKRGHTSLYGVGLVIDIFTGLVVDFVVLSAFCHQCTIHSSMVEAEEFQVWQEDHKKKGDCQQNYSGSAGGMEVAAALLMWKRSVAEWSCRYTTVLSDGDAKTFNKLCAEQVYGPDVEITKEECVNHVIKRMTTGLQTVVKDCKAQGITLGGRAEGSLKEATINKLATFYRLAILKNIPDVERMQRAILATLFHCSSTDQDPKHDYCPEGRDSWCFHNKAKALGKEAETHGSMSLKLNRTVADKVLPLYTRLSAPCLLQRCTRGGTQNANESLHSTIWRLCPKETFVPRDRIILASTRAVANFNMGMDLAVSMKKILATQQVTQASRSITQKRDQRRVEKSKNQRARTQQRFKRKLERRQQGAACKKSKSDEEMYGAGKF